LIKKIRDSLSAKVFIWIAGLLILCSLLIYGIVMIILPKSYTTVISTQFVNEMARFVETLADTNYEDASEVIEQFCQNNQAMVVLTDGGEIIPYGSISDESVEKGETLTYTAAATFKDRDGEYPLTVTAFSPTGQELTSLFLKLFPMVLLLIFLISFVGAILCSRIMVKPVLEISRISKRMSNLDMTWECRVDRTDELGVLANSLNVMAKRLDAAIKELEGANQKLKEDMEHITELSRQRRNFFAAASHELKTPITILKGQIESMIMGIGSYKDTKKVLPETLKEVENMERLVKEILAISKIEMDGMARKTEQFSISCHPLPERVVCPDYPSKQQLRDNYH
jgi:two-component system sensor histidine kinase VanS